MAYICQILIHLSNQLSIYHVIRAMALTANAVNYRQNLQNQYMINCILPS